MSVADLPMGMWLIQLAEYAHMLENSQMVKCLTESGLKFGLFYFKKPFFRTFALGNQWHPDTK